MRFLGGELREMGVLLGWRCVEEHRVALGV